jgi:poly-gamma-glutamate synthesis protein (capsule biosynthesis protein)
MPVSRAQQSETGADFVGRVIDIDGIPVAGAAVESRSGTAASDDDGWFRFAGHRQPEWLKVTASGFISRTRAAMPGVPVLFRLSPDDGKTTMIHFGGDTMFGRRFFDPNEDGFTADGLLPINPTMEDHLKLLAPVQPLLQNADLTVVNLETTLSDQPYFPINGPRPVAFHATASHVYASHSNSVMALKQAGVDLVDMGNNHNYDMLELGLNNSLSALDQAGMLHFGAGTDEANAWAPAIVSSKGQTIAFVGCTTLRIPLNTPIQNDISYTASAVRGKGGAAYCAEAALRSAVAQAKRQADLVVVMIHGGREYDRKPTTKINYLSAIARRAGANLVINHQPHVVGGFLWRDQALTAWTMGTFLADQTVWPALESYLLAVYVREGKVIRAYVEPLVIDGFLPHGLTGRMADSVARKAAGYETGPFVIENGAMEMDFGGRTLQHVYTQSMEGSSDLGTILSLPEAQWISDFNGSGKLLLGRDLLWVGGFENHEVDSASLSAPLWDLSTDSIQIGPDYAFEGDTGIRLARGARNLQDALTTNLRRIWVDPFRNLTITGMVRVNEPVAPLIQLSWYSAPSGPSFVKTIHPIEIKTYGTWQPFRIDIRPPSKAVALGLFLRLKPPERGTVTVDFDNIRIIEWARPDTPFSPLYDFALLTGSGEWTVTQQILPGAEEWVIIPPKAEIR